MDVSHPSTSLEDGESDMTWELRNLDASNSSSIHICPEPSVLQLSSPRQAANVSDVKGVASLRRVGSRVFENPSCVLRQGRLDPSSHASRSSSACDDAASLEPVPMKQEANDTLFNVSLRSADTEASSSSASRYLLKHDADRFDLRGCCPRRSSLRTGAAEEDSASTLNVVESSTEPAAKRKDSVRMDELSSFDDSTHAPVIASGDDSERMVAALEPRVSGSEVSESSSMELIHTASIPESCLSLFEDDSDDNGEEGRDTEKYSISSTIVSCASCSFPQGDSLFNVSLRSADTEASSSSASRYLLKHDADRFDLRGCCPRRSSLRTGAAEEDSASTLNVVESSTEPAAENMSSQLRDRDDFTNDEYEYVLLGGSDDESDSDRSLSYQR